jgi:hypothetical protein
VTVAARDFADAKCHGRGHAGPQQLPKLYDEPQLFFRPAVPEEAWIEIPLDVKRKEPLRLLLNATCAPDFGRYQAILDGVPVGDPMDFYAPEVSSKEFPLLDLWPEPGKHILRLEYRGKNKLSDGMSLGIESIRLRQRRPRVEQYGHDKDKDWRQNPKLLYK